MKTPPSFALTCLLLQVALVASAASPAPAPGAAPAPKPAVEVLGGCQGEGCECYRGYQSDKPVPVAQRAAIVTIRPFTLYKERSTQSPVLGTYQPGVKARPVQQEMVVDDPGEYLVVAVRNPKLGLKKGDRLDTMIEEGEGFARARKAGRWISFDSEDPVLKVVRKTRLTEWLTVEVNGLKGYTPQQPFEFCLE